MLLHVKRIHYILVLLFILTGLGSSTTGVFAQIVPDPIEPSIGDGNPENAPIEPPDPPDPPTVTGQTLRAPSAITITGRTSDALTITWHDRTSVEDGYELYLRRGNGDWRLLESWGALTEWTTFTSNDLRTDTLYCFQIRVFDSERTIPSGQRCAYTRDGRNIGVWRVQVGITTADVENAGTNDAVSIGLTSLSPPSGPAWAVTWMNYAHNDFERDSFHLYDLDFSSIREFSDISRLTITKIGSNGLCIEALELRVNEQRAYQQTFGDTSSTCHWLDNDNGNERTLVVSHQQLRAHPAWQNFSFTAPITPLDGDPDDPQVMRFQLLIRKAELISRIEAHVGNAIHGTLAVWGEFHGDPVEIERESGQAVHVDLDLAFEMPDPINNPELDINFDLVFSAQCTGEDATGIAYSIRSRDFSATVDAEGFIPGYLFLLNKLSRIVTPDIVDFLVVPDFAGIFEDEVEKGILAQWSDISQGDSITLSDIVNGATCEDARVEVDNSGNANLFFSVRLPELPLNRGGGELFTEGNQPIAPADGN